jgi:23S rRNA (cytidine1920-2'-O)/16S rRNA (cytidine1409-2'-O)-methyltransferase
MDYDNTPQQRLDLYLVDNEFFPSRAAAIAAIKQGCVYIDNHNVTKPAFIVRDNPDIVVQGACPWVSRGGLKLEHGLRHFGVDVADKICLDLGASTGGFSDVLLTYNAQTVYAVDVGHSQLHEKIANNPKIINLEQTPAKDLDDDIVPDEIDFLCIDVSFTSVTKVFGYVLPFLKPNADIIILCKPQFELNPKAIKKGMVKNPDDLLVAQQAVIDYLKSQAMCNIQAIDSPITGTDGNHEYLIFCQNASDNNDA